MRPVQLIIVTTLAMLCFAGNSLLCRVALRSGLIDAATFTAVRIVSGAIALFLIAAARGKVQTISGTWSSAFALFSYAAAFSFAYLTMPAATGALLLFGAVQATMILSGLRHNEGWSLGQIIGVAIAMAGLVTLLFPGLTSPPLIGSVLMVAAGIAWGLYSLRGQGADDPANVTTGNFIRALPFAVVPGLALFSRAHFEPAGLFYAITSGAITSGGGYVLWYCALPRLKATSAATVQLSVPVLAAIGGVALLGEKPTWRLIVASIAVLSGIGIVILRKSDARA